MAWQLSNSLTTDFCIDALQESIARFGTPDVFNTDQSNQFTSVEFTNLLKENGIRMSMDGKGCWRANIFVERFWHIIKYEEVYLKAHDSVSGAKGSLETYSQFYNSRRQHRSFAVKTPDTICLTDTPLKLPIRN